MGVREYPDTVRVYLDMDGPLADFERAVKIENSSIDIHKKIAGAYMRLPVTNGAQEAVRKIISLGFEPFSLTKIPRSNPYAATEKLLWTDINFPELHDRVLIVPDKGAVGRSCDILIDDHPEWANANNFKGTIIKFFPEEGWAPIISLLTCFSEALEKSMPNLKNLRLNEHTYEACIKDVFMEALKSSN